MSPSVQHSHVISCFWGMIRCRCLLIQLCVPFPEKLTANQWLLHVYAFIYVHHSLVNSYCYCYYVVEAHATAARTFSDALWILIAMAKGIKCRTFRPWRCSSAANSYKNVSYLIKAFICGWKCSTINPLLSLRYENCSDYIRKTYLLHAWHLWSCWCTLHASLHVSLRVCLCVYILYVCMCVGVCMYLCVCACM